MISRSRLWRALGIALPLAAGIAIVSGQDERSASSENLSDHSDCAFFAGRDRMSRTARPDRDPFRRGRFTVDATARRTFVPGGSRTRGFGDEAELGLIDREIFAALKEKGVGPAPKTTDEEFLRRVSLDLSGRVPTFNRTVAFINDTAADKRAKLIDELLESEGWVDKWTMYFGDLYLNSNFKASVDLQRFPPGRNAFAVWIRDSLSANKPYDQMARELISATGDNSFRQGPINWMAGGWVINNPQHDNWDQQAAYAAEQFLGIGHINCILCHNGRGHLDALSLWGSTASRTSAWSLAAFFSKTTMNTAQINAALDPNIRYWRVLDNNNADYPLNTTTGNRPSRQPIGATRNIAPSYPFSGGKPRSGETYRAAAAREITADLQFSRAIVNYIWKEMFSRGFVEPANQFDPARLDPDNPPTDLKADGTRWELQPSHPRLLNALAKDFIDHAYDLKWLMRTIANSETYQLSSRYQGEWRDEWEPLFARKLVRRLWAEELHDAIALTSNVPPSYNIDGYSTFNARQAPLFDGFPVYGNVSLAMRIPETRDLGGAPNAFLNSFLRGNRDDEDRRGEGSLLQALNLMNDNFVQSRVRANGPASSLMPTALRLSDSNLVDYLFLTVLSRYPTAEEMAQSLGVLKSGTRNTKAENLLWSLYNKVDFILNY